VKKFKDFSRIFKYIFKTYFSDLLLRCGHIKSNRINFVLLTVVTSYNTAVDVMHACSTVRSTVFK